MVSDYLNQLKTYIEKSDHIYQEIYEPGLAIHPIPFFGNIHTAKVLTVGVNPSNREFKGRNWPEKLSTQELTERLLHYFDGRNQPYWSWFKYWEFASNSLNLSYKNGGVAHLDLSPRATISMSKAPEESFLKMVESDIAWFFKLLPLCKNTRLIMMAGGVTNKYMHDFVGKIAGNYGYQMHRIKIINGAPGPTSLHKLQGKGFDLPVFFCGMSPSGNEPTVLVSRIEENKAELLSYLV